MQCQRGGGFLRLASHSDSGKTPYPRSVSLEPGSVVGGDFEIVAPLSEGGMGAVYSAPPPPSKSSRAPAAPPSAGPPPAGTGSAPCEPSRRMVLTSKDVPDGALQCLNEAAPRPADNKDHKG